MQRTRSTLVTWDNKVAEKQEKLIEGNPSKNLCPSNEIGVCAGEAY